MPAIYGLVTVLVLICSILPVYADSGSAPPPTAAFASLPRIESIQLSPSGRHLAANFLQPAAVGIIVISQVLAMGL